MWDKKMRKSLRASFLQKPKIFLVLFLILISLILNSLNISNFLPSPSISSFNPPQSLEEAPSSQIVLENTSNLKIDELVFDKESIQYYIEQGGQFNLKTRQMKQMVSTSYTNVSIRSKIINSSFQILSIGENGSNQWQNDIEPDYGDVNVTTIFSGGENTFRLNFSENGETPASGITNTKFLLSSNPNLTSFPTIVSFDFRIPSLTPELLSSPHTLALEFRFNTSSITYILSDFGGNLGEILEKNVTRPSGSDSLYILCNETAPFSWRHVSYNITQLITTYFSPEEYPKFTNLKTLFCYMITFTPEYQLTLDINNIEYFTSLPPYSPINYTLGETMIFTENGLLSYNSTMGNFTFNAYEDFPWNNNSQTYLEVNITRIKSLEGFCLAKDWNDTKVRINLYLDIPTFLEGASSSIIYILLPSDWTNINIVNQSIVFEFNHQTQMLNEFILGKRYRGNVYGLDWGILEAWSPNYFANIVVPTDISRNEVIKVRGDLRYPLSGSINLYFHNESFFYHQTTLPMINSTFVFSEITITEQFPSGILQFTLNWSNPWEFGVYEKLVYIHEEASQNSIILFHSSQNVNLHQFESLLINLSLQKDGNKYRTNSTLVLSFKGSECLFFSQTTHKNFILNVSHVVWEPGNYTLDIIASDGSSFFARGTVNLTVEPASIFWSFENLQSILLRNESVSFRLYSYIHPQGEEFFQPLSGLIIRIWINDTVISNHKTNLEGFADISFYFEYSAFGDWLQVAVEGMLEGKVLKLQTLLFYISNETAPASGDRAYIHEIMRSPVKANETFYIYYNIEYSNNNSNWYVPVESFSSVILSAYILRGNYVIGTNFENQMLIWTLEANHSIIDTLVLELLCPTVLVTNEVLSKKFRIKLEIYSDITTNNLTIEIDLKYLGLPFSNLSLLDSLNRDITNLFLITVKGSIFTVSQLNIISGLEVCYFLEGNLQELEIEVRRSFRFSYLYNESIVGSWKINTPINYSYSILYTILGFGTWECFNTSLEVFPNTSSIITAFLPSQKWNSSISIKLVVQYFTDLVVASVMQNFTISDPIAPTLDYSIEPFSDIIRIHAFVYEPEKASGVKNTSLLMGEQSITATSFSLNHYTFDIPMNTVNSQFIKIIAIDWAGNEISSEFININEFLSNSQSPLKLLESQFFFPAFFSLVIICGILIARIIKKRKTSIF